MGMGVTVSAEEGHFITFDAPGAVEAPEPVQINLEGAIAGYYFDGNGVSHGFVRSPDGHFTTFDAPGAGTVADKSQGTFPAGLNVEGTIAGYYNDEHSVGHGFIRWRDGKIITFEAPGADLNPADEEGTSVSGLNDLGVISGYYGDSKGLVHGYVRSANGKFTSFEAPGSGGEGTFPTGPLNVEGAIVGYYTDPNLLFHAFVRYPDGKFATFVGPDSCDTGVKQNCYGSGAYNINLFGTSVGAYEDNSGKFVAHSFVRTADGKITTFEAPGAGTGTGQGTGFDQIAGFNDEGTVTATYLDDQNVYHGYVRKADGKITTFDAPGADLKANSYSGTLPVSLNNLGTITGFFIDTEGVGRGFILVP
jgi:hypothetical protein